MGRVRLFNNAMPRKKLASTPDTVETPTTTPPTTPNEETKPKKPSRAKKVVKAEPESVASAPSAVETLAVDVPLIAEAVELLAVPTPAPKSVAKPKRSVTKKSAKAKPTEAMVDPIEVVAILDEVTEEVIEEITTELVVEAIEELDLLDTLDISQLSFRPRTSRKKDKVQIPVKNVETPAIDVPAVESKPTGRPSKKTRRGAKEEPVSVPTVSAIPIPIFTIDDETLLIGGEELPVPEWRPRQKPSSTAPAAPASEGTSTAAEGREPSSRRRRDRRRKSGSGASQATAPTDLSAADDEPTEAETPVVAAPTTTQEVQPEPEIVKPTFRRDKTVVAPPPKPAIEIPDNAPQIVMRDGIPTLVRNHRVYPPIMFFGSPADERRATIVLDELKMAAEAGIHLHSFLIDFEVDPEQVDHAAGFAGYMLAKAVEVDPQAQIIFRVVFQATRGWQDKYPNARFKYEDGSLAEPSVCDDEFWMVAQTCLERFTKLVRLLPQSESILGLHIERGEWFFAEGLGYDNSKAAQTKFRDWARTRYNNDEVTLRASWFDGSARFDNIVIPEYGPEGTEDEKFIRSSRKQRKYVDYHLFLSDATVQRVGDLAYAAKAASDGYFLIGASYGYTFEWSHPSSGHLSLGKLLRTPEIDFIAGPPSYRTREPGGSAAFPCPIDSFALNGKLYISEEDFKTSLSTGHEPDDFNTTLKTPQALEGAHWRGAGVALAHASGVAWMDLWGNGWLKTNSVWERAAQVREALTDRMQTDLGDPEVAIFIDERALAYLVDSNAFKLLVQNVRESVLRAGVSAAFYLLSDLAHREKFPESKLYLFLNAWDVRPELRSAIKSRLQRDNKVLFWLYSAGLFDAGRDSLERAREVTGIALKPQPFYSKSGTTILNRRHPLSEAFPDRSLIGSTKLEPSYFAIPEGATVLGEYTQTGLPSFVVREFKDGPADSHWTSIFLGEPTVNAALIRGLAQMAGAHVWNFHEDVVHVRAPFCTIHCSGAGPRTITLPNKFSAYNLLTNEWASVDSTNLRFTAMDGSTHVFLVGPKEDLEHFLDSNPSSVLKMDELPKREANVRGDISTFDVPIMKLDEWMEGGDNDEVADEWFLRPQHIVEEPETEDEGTEKIGRRRRKRSRGRNDRGGSEETAGPRREQSGPADPILGDLGMNVMFRKRE